MDKICVITGGSSGIGKACAEKFSQNGWKVYELSRSGADFDGVKHITADVSKFETVENAIGQIYNEAGKIDLLINNAGFGISGAAEYTKTEDAEKQFKVNFFGTFNGMKAVVPYMRKAGGGKIINVSSVAAIMPIPFQSFYSASKSAINSLTMSFANEVRDFNVKVCAVMPGDVKTGFTGARQKFENCDAYGDRVQKSVAVMEKDEMGGAAPESIAKKIYKISLKKNPAPIYTLGGKYKFFKFLGDVLPQPLVNKILYMMYAK